MVFVFYSYLGDIGLSAVFYFTALFYPYWLESIPLDLTRPFYLTALELTTLNFVFAQTLLGLVLPCWPQTQLDLVWLCWNQFGNFIHVISTCSDWFNCAGFDPQVIFVGWVVVWDIYWLQYPTTGFSLFTTPMMAPPTSSNRHCLSLSPLYLPLV